MTTPRAAGQEPPPAEAPAPFSETGPVLEALRALESRRDAKCHSTACRFENYVFGTPLTDEGRDERAGLQKEFVRRVWQRASRAAAEAGETSVGPERLAPAIAELVRIEETEQALRVTFPGREPIELSRVRAAQYGSISYALRAILAVQQDFLLSGGEQLLKLAPAGIEALQRALDAVSLCALGLADREARDRNEAELGGERLRAAWRALVPAEESAEAAEGTRIAAPSDASRAEALGVLRGIIAAKTAAYEAYNEIPRKKVGEFFIENGERYYARYPMPQDEQTGQNFQGTFHRLMVEFSLELLRAGEESANAAGHELVRSDDAVRALDALVPQYVDDLEDVHFFPRLKPEARYTLEAYDCDSFRDYGLHWGYLLRALEDRNAPRVLPDPFAAEVLAETVSQYGVLLLRAAGQMAKEELAAPTLRPMDLVRGARIIQRKAALHAKAPEPTEDDGLIVSTASTPLLEPGTRFFSDATQRSGIAYRHVSSEWLSEFRRKEVKRAPTFSGGGLAAEDVDEDGDPDLLFVGGRGNALYANDGTGRFNDVTAQAGLSWKRPAGAEGEAANGEARQPLIADFDNDGKQDVLITYANDPHRLYRNRGELRFEDVTEKAGLGGAGKVGGPATAFDFDRDGLLDLYLCYFGDYLAGEVPLMDRDSHNALPNALFKNAGWLIFRDVTEGSGTADTGWAQAVSHTDFDRDGLQDLIVANDFGRNAWLRNKGGGKFEDVGPALGITDAYHSMNVGIADLNADDFPEVYISNIATMVKDNKYVLPDVTTPLNLDPKALADMLVKESDMLYMSQAKEGRLARYEPSHDIERGPTSTGWAWDAEFFDLDHDGDDDLYVVNGLNDYFTYDLVHTYEGAGGKQQHAFLSHSRESNVLFLNQDGKLKNVAPGSGADLLSNSRSTAYLDLEGDGDLDIALNNFHDKATILANEAGVAGGNWLKIRLVGDPTRGCSRDAIGARLVLSGPDGLRVAREVQGGSGYLSMNPKEQHFGLGLAQTVDLRILWPNGKEQLLKELAANRRYVLRQGSEEAEPR